jgi:hypothetical protein
MVAGDRADRCLLIDLDRGGQRNRDGMEEAVLHRKSVPFRLVRIAMPLGRLQRLARSTQEFGATV